MKKSKTLGLFAFGLFLLCFMLMPSKALAKTYKCENQADYAIYKASSYSFQFIANNKKKKGNKVSFSISIPEDTPSDTAKKLKKMKFKYVCDDSATDIEYGKTYKLSKNKLSQDCVVEGNVSFTAVDGSGNPVKDSAGNVQKCDVTVKFTPEMEDYGDEVWSEEGENDIDPSCKFKDRSGEANKNDINCNQPNGTFETEFCEAKNGALAEKNSGQKNVYFTNFGVGSKQYDDVRGKDLSSLHKTFKDRATTITDGNGKSEKVALFKCNIKKVDAPAGATGDAAYYLNRGYMYGSGTVTINFGRYQYHYNGKKAVTRGKAVKCKIKCEEAVTAEYGAPVASKAGLCFQYKVKVTSRVNCDMDTAPDAPNTDKRVCSPSPICVHMDGSTVTGVYKQGGPNSDFDKCINECDGGKYTEKCSNSCYQKVYKNSQNNGEQMSNVNKRTASVQQLANGCNASLPSGGYYYKQNGEILWAGGGWARWYKEHTFGVDWGIGSIDRYTKTINGIPRGSNCTDYCWWYGCDDSNIYLNPGYYKYDLQQNTKLYNQAVDLCTAKATCTTSTAEFSISVGYTGYKNSDTYTEIQFPFTSMGAKNTDKLSSGQNTANTATANNTTLLGYDGCYKSDNARKWYQAEWSFPGSWINNKTGEISYIKKTDSGWSSMNKAFCIPLNARNVNTNWWNWYMNRKLSGTDTSYKNTSYQNQCESGSSKSINNITNVSAGDISKWNINANTTKFGYYEWDIHLQCFYALNTNVYKVTTSNGSNSNKDQCCTGECCGNKDCKPQSYRIRSVDLENMFPSSDGREVSDSGTGRTPGFNWSSYATNTKNNSGYSSNPVSYLAKVQSLGYQVYDNDYLDYHFELSKDDLNSLKSESARNGSYVKFDGDVSVRENGVSSYFSEVIRKYTSEAPKAREATTCNNLINYNASGCQK